MNLNTHLLLDGELCGEVVELKENMARVVLKTAKRMAADENGLIHGGFTFSAADFAAMAAINDPNVVLIEAKVKFTAPVKLSDTVQFIAKVVERSGKRALVEVKGVVDEHEVFLGEFHTYTPSKHILQK